MKIIEKYTGTKTYMFPNGSLATPEVMQTQFPAVLTFSHIIETDEAGEVAFAVQNLSAMRSFYKIDPRSVRVGGHCSYPGNRLILQNPNLSPARRRESRQLWNIRI